MSVPRSQRWVSRWTDLVRSTLGFSSIPFTALPFSRGGVGRLVAQRVKSLREECRDAPVHLVLDGLHAGAAFFSGHRFAWPSGVSRVLYRAHNVESELWRQSSEYVGGARRQLVKTQWRRMWSFETRLLSAVDVTLPVSDEDRARLEAMAPGIRAKTVRIGWDVSERALLPAREAGPLRFVFIGRMDWAPNRQGLQWFLEEVWPAASVGPGPRELVIAGAGDSAWVEKYRSLHNVRFLGRIDDPCGLYREADALLVPLFTGSGTRVKAIEASAYGIPCLSTALGVEGTGLLAGTSYLRAEGRSEWLSQIGQAGRGPLRAVGLAAHAHAKAVFNAEAIAAEFVAILDAASGVPPA